ncbi:hypothetical protein [Rhizobium sp. NFR07]|uniref:hypothetical protein n=1 Tax=Rhizobium sp. NFR07 TaxID=1566262 RepID=UPI0015A5EDC1|nr:hypothetical protein [Rhizobium sp. NFR07]
MRRPTRPFIAERKPAAPKMSVWTRLNADIAHGLEEEQEGDRPEITKASGRR